MYDFTKLVSPASSVAAYRLASLMADRHDQEAAAILTSADLEEMCVVLAGALSAAYWHQDPYTYRDRLRRMAASALASREKDFA